MQTVAVQTRVPKVMKAKVVKILSHIGLDLSTANRIFYAKIIAQKGLPFSVKEEPEVSWKLSKEEKARREKNIQAGNPFIISVSCTSSLTLN